PTRLAAAAVRAGRTFSAALPTTTATEPARQRSPALPKAELRMAATAISGSASGITTMWFLAPPSACTRLPLAAAVAGMETATGPPPPHGGSAQERRGGGW